jgi:type I restriction enzyme R subunit
MAWKTADGRVEASRLESQLQVLIQGMLGKATLLDLLRHFIVFEKSRKEDADTGIITIQTVKKLAAYHQYYAVNRAVQSTLRAAGFDHASAGAVLPDMAAESPARYTLGLAGSRSLRSWVLPTTNTPSTPP